MPLRALSIAVGLLTVSLPKLKMKLNYGLPAYRSRLPLAIDSTFVYGTLVPYAQFGRLRVGNGKWLSVALFLGFAQV